MMVMMVMVVVMQMVEYLLRKWLLGKNQLLLLLLLHRLHRLHHAHVLVVLHVLLVVLLVEMVQVVVMLHLLLYLVKMVLMMLQLGLDTALLHCAHWVWVVLELLVLILLMVHGNLLLLPCMLQHVVVMVLQVVVMDLLVETRLRHLRLKRTSGWVSRTRRCCWQALRLHRSGARKLLLVVLVMLVHQYSSMWRVHLSRLLLLRGWKGRRYR